MFTNTKKNYKKKRHLTNKNFNLQKIKKRENVDYIYIL